MTATDHDQQRRPGLPLVLAICDGWGLSDQTAGNPLKHGQTPFVDAVWKNAPHTSLLASGQAVGLPDGQPGNSEAGHLNIGAGRVVVQDGVRVSRSIADGTFFRNPAFAAAIHHVKKHRSRLHLIGIMPVAPSTHSDPQHVYALLDLVQREGVEQTYLHLFTDGRDSPPRSAPNVLAALEPHLSRHETIATIAGRFYLDRKKRWAVTERIYSVLVDGGGSLTANSPTAAVAQAYARQETDQFIQPTIVARDGTEATASRIRSGDSVIFFNQRSDRARQLTKPFVQEKFEEENPGAFVRPVRLTNLTFVALTDFGPDLDHILTAYPSEDINNSLTAVLRPWRQLYIAETEKYAHITYFFNGGYAQPVAGETRLLIPSPDVKHYDERPDMSTREIAATVLKYLKEHSYDIIVVNFAAPDMIAHTGNELAARQAVRTVDACLKTLADEIKRQHGTMIITADHGNIEEMIDRATNEVDPQHSTNPVPFILLSERLATVTLASAGKLADIAPTILKTLDVPQPAEMTGRPLW